MNNLRTSDLTLCILGGAATYTPEFIYVLSQYKKSVKIGTVRLFDTDTEHLTHVQNYCQGLAELLDFPIKVEAYDNQKLAICEADIVLIQFRVGGLVSRSNDIKLCLRHGLLGEETTGIGGFSFALRTIPVLFNVISLIREYAPSALVINLSNPTGIVTEVLQKKLENQVVGICTTPERMKVGFAKRLSISADKIFIDYVGLNHLGWVQNIYNKDDQIPKDKWLPLSSDLLSVKEVPDLTFSTELLHSIGAAPSLYLHYYYHKNQVIETLLKMPLNRAEIRMRESNKIFDFYQQGMIKLPEQFSNREDLYDVAGRLIHALLTNENDQLVLNVRNNRSLPQLPINCVIESPCDIRNGQIIPSERRSTVDNYDHIGSMLFAQKCYEQLTIQAGTGDKRAAIQAMITHPLGPSAEIVHSVFSDILRTFDSLLPQF